MSTQPIHSLTARPDVWRGYRGRLDVSGYPSGFPALDALLQCGGWPRQGLVELLPGTPGAGGLQLLLPALAALTRSGESVAMVSPPGHLCAPALLSAGVVLEHLLVVTPPPGQLLWSCEQILRSAAVAALVVWPTGVRLDVAALRRLQLAAREGGCWASLLRGPDAASQPSVARLRLRLERRDATWVALHVLKQLGGGAGRHVNLALPIATGVE